MKPRICLVTTGQPSTNPRLVKEADALAEAAYSVHVIGARRASWADESDRELLASRAWTAEIIGPRRGGGSRRLAAAVRHRLARFAGGMKLSDAMMAAAITPVAPQLTAAALSCPADLYIAHNLGALPAASAAAAKHGARLGFDAEDFHSGQFADTGSGEARMVRRAEERFVPRCHYVTASSPGIADQYAALTGGAAPVVILNVFPLAHRPQPAATPQRKTGPRRLYWFSQTIGRDRGLEEAVTAVGQLQDLDLELHLRGEWQADYEDRLRGLARMVGARQEQIVAHPPAAADEMVRLAASYDLGLALEPGHTVNNDLALSNKIFTYLLAGVPVLASATTAQRGLAEVAGDSVRTFPAGDASALGMALRAWITDPAALDTARQSAWLQGTRRFNWDAEQHKFLSAVARVLADRQGAALRLAEMAS